MTGPSASLANPYTMHAFSAEMSAENDFDVGVDANTSVI